MSELDERLEQRKYTALYAELVKRCVVLGRVPPHPRDSNAARALLDELRKEDRMTGKVRPDGRSESGVAGKYDEATDHALDVVAAHYAVRLLANAADGWEDYPELGEHDFRDVVRRVIRLGGAGPSTQDYTAAYAHLAGRASGVQA